MKLMKPLKKLLKSHFKMRKLLLSLLVALPICLPNQVWAADSYINNMKIVCSIDQKGTATITETWDMQVSSGSEVYKTFNNMHQKNISIISVSEGKKTYKNIGDWDVDASKSEKAYKCGINETDSGYELCMGIGSYGHKTYTMKYQITHLVNKYKDTYAINYAFMGNMSLTVKKATVLISSQAQSFTANKDKIWGFGYEGRCDFMEDGKIYMTTSGKINKMQLLSKLSQSYSDPDTTYKSQSWKSVYDDAMNGASFSKKENDNVSYEMGESESDDNDWIYLVIFGLIALVILLIIIYNIAITIMRQRAKDRFDDGSIFDPKEVHPFRDIPTKDISYFYYLAYQMGIAFKDGGLMSAYVLKWLKDEQISIDLEKKGLFKKQSYNINFKKELKSDDPHEEELYKMFVSAAGKNRILETKEFDAYCKEHYKKVNGFFTKVINDEAMKLSDQGKRVKIDYQKVFGIDVDSHKHIFPSSLREDMEHIYGLKKFLLDEHNMEEKKAIEVHLWQEYLMFAAIFGIAEEVEKQLKVIQPRFYDPQNIDTNYYNYFTACYIMDSFVSSGVSTARQAYSTANSGSAFSGGGGGASFGGGGGGFSGGGGGGVR